MQSLQRQIGPFGFAAKRRAPLFARTARQLRPQPCAHAGDLPRGLAAMFVAHSETCRRRRDQRAALAGALPGAERPTFCFKGSRPDTRRARRGGAGLRRLSAHSFEKRICRTRCIHDGRPELCDDRAAGRCRGMTMMRMPLSIWGILMATVLGLLAFPALFVSAIMMTLDSLAGTSFFMPAISSMDNRRRTTAVAPVVPALVLVFFRSSGGLHRRVAGFRHRVRSAQHACTETYIRYRMMVWAILAIGCLSFVFGLTTCM